MNLRRLVKPLGFVAVGLLYFISLSSIGLMMLITNPLTDERLPMRPFFEVWPFIMLLGLVVLVWRHREPAAWWLALAIGFAPPVAIALIGFGVGR